MRTPLSNVKFLACCTVLFLGTVQAQAIYRIVGADGKVTFSDKPPATAANVATRGGASKPADANPAETALPYELRQTVARFPVSLYTGQGCAPCTSGRQLLQGRGIPFTEFTVSSNEDVEALQRISGDRSLPFLTIGGQKIKGFSEAEWTQYLNAANYPASSQLASGYRNPQAKPLVAVQKPALPVEPADTRVAEQQQSTEGATEPPPVPVVGPSNPAGIKF